MIARLPLKTFDDGTPTADLEAALRGVPKVTSVKIALEGREAVVDHDGADQAQLDSVVAKAGFGLTSPTETEGTRVGPP